nr:MAG TPA: hypothetical protein [Caudoviricetes sp.]
MRSGPSFPRAGASGAKAFRQTPPHGRPLSTRLPKLPPTWPPGHRGRSSIDSAMVGP